MCHYVLSLKTSKKKAKRLIKRFKRQIKRRKGYIVTEFFIPTTLQTSKIKMSKYVVSALIDEIKKRNRCALTQNDSHRDLQGPEVGLKVITIRTY